MYFLIDYQILLFSLRISSLIDTVQMYYRLSRPWLEQTPTVYTTSVFPRRIISPYMILLKYQLNG